MKPAALFLLLALCTVPTCAAFTSVRPHPTLACMNTVDPPPGRMRDGSTVALPPLPKWVPSVIDSVPVTLVKNLYCNGQKVVGCFTYASRTIEIEDSMSLFNQWLVVRHEIVHSALFDAGLRFKDAASEDAVADAIAAQQLVEMSRGWPR
jgi:hypothetical protein